MKKLLFGAMVLALFVASCSRRAASPSHISASAGSAGSSDLDARIRRVENGLLEMGANGQVLGREGMSLAGRMAHYGVPGVSFAVIQDYEIEWAKGYGVLEAGSEEAVTLGTLFNAGSILKPVSAAAALALVERGELELDGDVNDKLISWHIPDNAYTAEQKATLRRLLSHSAGLTDGFTNRSSGDAEPDYVAPAGEAPTVTIQQMLDAEPGVDVDGPTRVTMVPGTEWRYANADYAILSLLVADVAGKPFPQFMDETVLAPLGMASSTFEQPLPEGLRARAATEHYESGQPFDGKRHHYPIGGLWATPSDLARFAIEIMRAYKGRSSKVLSPQMAREMLTPQIDTQGDLLGDSFGLGVQLGGTERSFRLVHTGGTWGSTCVLWVYPETGQGAVVMTNSAGNQGILRFEILVSIANEYGWP